ncbi:MAG TPA: hypothetical protein VFA33_01265 [Bryobacteraceae bacterium]|nr:hypothetical protein [Bryobacteraceae bacterium]
MKAGLLAGLCCAAAWGAGGPEAWVPVRWDGGPLAAALRAGGRTSPSREALEAIARWYEPATLALVQGTPINCLLLTLSGGSDRELEKRQLALVQAYARKARERGLAVLGLVSAGSDPAVTAAAAVQAQLDGVALEGEFPAASYFAEQVRKSLRARNHGALVIPVVSPEEALREEDQPVVAVAGVSPGVGKMAESATASATAGIWVDSNLWLARSLRAAAPGPVWLSHAPGAGTARDYARSIADAAAEGAQWIVTLHDDLRPALRNGDAAALELWRTIARAPAFFGEHTEWRGFAPYGRVGIVLDPAGANPAMTQEYLNLVARRQIPYRVIRRAQLSAPLPADLRALLAFDLAPPTEAERRLLSGFAAQGGLVLGGPAWGTPPRDQPYAVASTGEGEVAIYKEDFPDPQSVARDLNDLLNTPDFGVSLFNAPSVLPAVSTSPSGAAMLIQMVNYSDTPASALSIWVARQCRSARLYTPEGPPADLPLKRGSRRTEIAIPRLGVYGALLLE